MVINKICSQMNLPKCDFLHLSDSHSVDVGGGGNKILEYTQPPYQKETLPNRNQRQTSPQDQTYTLPLGRQPPPGYGYYCTWYVVLLEWILVTLTCSGGSKGGARDAHPPGGPNCFNFMHFLGKFGKIVCWCPPGELAPPPRGNPGSATDLY